MRLDVAPRRFASNLSSGAEMWSINSINRRNLGKKVTQACLPMSIFYIQYARYDRTRSLCGRQVDPAASRCDRSLCLDPAQASKDQAHCQAACHERAPGPQIQTPAVPMQERLTPTGKKQTWDPKQVLETLSDFKKCRAPQIRHITQKHPMRSEHTPTEAS